MTYAACPDRRSLVPLGRSRAASQSPPADRAAASRLRVCIRKRPLLPHELAVGEFDVLTLHGRRTVLHETRRRVDDAKELFDRTPNHVEGGADGGWTCIDFGDVIVNVMTPSSREFYNIDEIWKNAERVDLSEVVSPEGPDDLLDDEDLFN